MKEIKAEELEFNPVSLFKNTWGALTAGSEETGFNAMCIAWGSVGTLWERGNRAKMIPVCNVYVSPHKFTNKKLHESEYFTVSFMDKTHRKNLAYIGSHHGYDDPNKIENAGLKLVRDGDTAYMDDSDMVFVCRKIYNQRLTGEGFVEKDLIDLNYHGNTDVIHEMFIGEIIKVLVKD